LPPQCLDIVVFDLGRVGVDLPARGVDVAPLRRHHGILGRARAQPLAEELLGAPVGARRVEVAHTALQRRVEHRVRALAQRGDGAVGAEVPPVPEVEVAGAAHRRQPEPESRHARRVRQGRRRGTSGGGGPASVTQ
jgi:hypothetical protein